MKNWMGLLLGAVLAAPGSLLAAKPLNVFTTTADLADVVRAVGGERVRVESLSKGYQDAHFVEAKPSLIVKLMSADLFIQTGLELEAGWATVLVQGSRNSRIQLGAPGYLDASSAVKPLEVPQNPDRAMGDVHPGGNPHYMLDPENVRLVAREIAKRLSSLSPADSAFFRERLGNFEVRLEENLRKWKERMEPFRGARFVSYHRNLPYFADRFGLISVGEVEPKPGIPPTAAHTADLIGRMKAEKVGLIITQPYYEDRSPASIAKQTGATVVVFSMAPSGEPGGSDYFSNMDANIESVRRALAAAAGTK
ncbi:MAG TPA: metal ABC transporter substrate-binding protein [Elusimicrobiota bacterium]|nr:metal ABC transporter substrate-binding protein [Elusimicrobiota bacterium]